MVLLVECTPGVKFALYDCCIYSCNKMFKQELAEFHTIYVPYLHLASYVLKF